MRSTRSRTLVGLYYFVFGVGLFLTGVLRPEYNWDLIPYLASSKALESTDLPTIHGYAYSSIESSQEARNSPLAQPQFDTPYRVLMRSNPSAFGKILPYYQVRVAYVGMINILSRCGVDVVFASYCISAVATMVAMFVLLLLSSELCRGWYQYLLPPLALALGLTQTARLSTPDGLAVMMVLACAYSFVRKPGWLLLLLPVLVTVRTDLIIIVILFSAALVFRNSTGRVTAVASLILALGILLLLDWHYHFPGWRSIFTFTFIERMALDDSSRFGIQTYLLALIKGGWAAWNNPSFMLFCAGAGTGVYFAISRYRGRPVKTRVASDGPALLAISILYVVVRLLLFPLPDERFLVGAYLLTMLSLFAMLPERHPGSATESPQELKSETR